MLLKLLQKDQSIEYLVIHQRLFHLVDEHLKIKLLIKFLKEAAQDAYPTQKPCRIRCIIQDQIETLKLRKKTSV